jgi:carboxymethylenebutenolidase
MGDMVTYASDGARSDGYLGIPKSGYGPGVVVIQEWWGLVPHIQNLVDRFAAAGFVALAPDLYHGATSNEPDEAQQLLMGMAMDTAAADIAGAARYLFEHDATTGDGIGVVGFCMGGSLALWSPTLAPNVVAAVGFYPAIPWERMSPTWSNYAGKTAMIHCSEEDGTSSAPGIQQAVAAIESAEGSVEVFDYPKTMHAFFNDDRSEVYDASASREAWDRTLQMLRRRLVS